MGSEMEMKMATTTMAEDQRRDDWWDDEDEVLGDAFAVHPGLILKNHVLPARRVRTSELADAIGMARPGLSNMLNGRRALTEAVALKIEKAIDYPAELLIGLQMQHNLAVARETTDVSHVRKLEHV
jgi:addiction module HigA family antidote